MYPALVVQKSIITPIKFYFQKRQTLQECYALIDRLQTERDELLAQNIQLNAMIDYEQEIAELVSFKQQYLDGQGTIAHVLVKHLSEQSQYFLIDKGADAGITVDMVAVYKNCLLGKVVEVFPQYSKVLLITDRLCKVAAYCPHTQTSGIHEGNNQEMITGMKYVSHLAQVEPDDLVLSSGDGLVFPKGFALGKIKTCNPEELFYDLSVELLCDLRTIEYCVLLQKGSSHSMVVQAALDECNTTTHIPKAEQESVEAQPIKIVGPLNMNMVHHADYSYINPQELLQQQRFVAREIEHGKGVLDQA